MGASHISNRSEQQARRWSRRGLLTVLGVTPAAAALTGCSGWAGAANGTTTASAKAAAKKPTVSVTPADGTKKAGFTSPVEVTVTGGTLASVKVTGNDGSPLAGSLNDTKTRWTSARNPYSGTKYTVTATPEGAAAHTATFTTRSPGETFLGYFTPEANSTSGVGMPVSINFTHAVKDRAAVQKAITVTAEPAVEVVGHWFGDTRLDFRPETYWAPGPTYPVSGGNAQHTTWSGIMVISERFKQTRMESSTVGLGDEYDISDVPHAQRLTASGTFVHGNYWASASAFGHQNTSHGCVGLHDAKGANDGEKTVDPANGLNGWNLPWSQWQAGSTL
ncbi:Ig-like domain-containing protein [Streptomyces sp. NPDC001351]|uniref:L,D-transpeptidase n=1 Tax=Streptomyces sp. NPDC001351 TaxID=3364564 RepID=UPI00368A118D